MSYREFLDNIEQYVGKIVEFTTRFKADGDIVRVYESSFGKDSVLRLHSFYEGPIVKVYPLITDYDFDFMVEKAVSHGKELPSHSWMYGHVIRGHASHSRDVRLIRKAEQTKDDKEVYGT